MMKHKSFIMKETHESRHYTTSIRARTMAGSEGTEFGKETWEKWTNVVKAGRGKPWGTKGKGGVSFHATCGSPSGFLCVGNYTHTAKYPPREVNSTPTDLLFFFRSTEREGGAE